METTKSNIYVRIDGDGITAAVIGSENTIFAGIKTSQPFTKTLGNKDRINELLIRAVNNRTRERNYFRLYNQLLEKDITDDEFDNEIDKNEDDYVVTNNEDADLNDINIALSLSPYLKDVKDVDDMADLFSFSDNSIRKSLSDK